MAGVFISAAVGVGVSGFVSDIGGVVMALSNLFQPRWLDAIHWRGAKKGHLLVFAMSLSRFDLIVENS